MDLTKTDTKVPMTTNTSFMLPQTMDEAFRFAEMAAKSDLVPKDYRNKPGNIIIAMQMGQELGLKPIQAVQNIAVINGRPSLWGDAMIALIRAHPTCEYIRETYDTQSKTARCQVKRRGQQEETREFSMEQAKTAGLTGKGPWKQYPARMLQQRARGYALRDVWPDVLTGLVSAEEAMDSTVDAVPAGSSTSSTLKDKLASKAAGRPEPEPVADVEVIDEQTGEVTATDPEPEPEPAKPCLDIDDCLGKIAAIDNIPHLENWYRKNAGWFTENLSDDGVDKIISACKARKDEIAASLQGDDNAPDRIRCPHGVNVPPSDCQQCDEVKDCPAWESA